MDATNAAAGLDRATLEQLLAAAREAAELAGRMSLAAWPGAGGRAPASRPKADGSLVSEVDRAVEGLVCTFVAQRFPGHALIGEEQGEGMPDPETITWVVDPIDGTANFLRGLPFFTTEIAVFSGGTPVVGVSAAPALGRTLWACRGGGAFMNEARLSVSDVAALDQAFIAHGGVPHFEGAGLLEGLGRLCADAGKSRGFGDCWSYHELAAGRIDAVVEARAKLWDLAAVSVLVSEAGGKVTDLRGEAIGPRTRSLVASNGRLHAQVLSALSARSPG